MAAHNSGLKKWTQWLLGDQNVGSKGASIKATSVAQWLMRMLSGGWLAWLNCVMAEMIWMWSPCYGCYQECQWRPFWSLELADQLGTGSFECPIHLGAGHACSVGEPVHRELWMKTQWLCAHWRRRPGLGACVMTLLWVSTFLTHRPLNECFQERSIHHPRRLSHSVQLSRSRTTRWIVDLELNERLQWWSEGRG